MICRADEVAGGDDAGGSRQLPRRPLGAGAAGRAELPSYLELVDKIGINDRRAVWDEVINALASLDRLARGWPGRPALQAYARAQLRPRFDRLGWDTTDPGNDEETLLRSRLIPALGDLGDRDIIAEAHRRFAGFVQNPQSLPAALRDAVIHAVGISADRASYETLLALARKSTVTTDRVRYYYAAASAATLLARATLALTLTDELPGTIRGGVINTVGCVWRAAGSRLGFRAEPSGCAHRQTGPQFPRRLHPRIHDKFQR